MNDMTLLSSHVEGDSGPITLALHASPMKEPTQGW